MENQTAALCPIPESLTVYMEAAPYPEVTGGDDPETVALLKQDYAGTVSETTAIFQYTYQHIISAACRPAFANAIITIGKVEMRHLELLGDAIHALGGSARFGDGRHYWQASVVNYADAPEAMLAANIDAERAAIQRYQEHAAQTPNVSVKALLLRIIQDERAHLRFFEEQLAGGDAG